jgi:N-glycosylase/DNA lyase
MFDDTAERPRYVTVIPAAISPTRSPEPLFLQRHSETRLQWTASFDATAVVMDLLRLRDDLVEIRDSMPEQSVVADAFEEWHGLRIPNDPVFPSLISFICSPQMRVERIHDMQLALAETYGDSVHLDGETYAAFPTPEQLAAATEKELRELKLGYRAPYVKRTAEMVADRDPVLIDIAAQPYEEARDAMQEFVGVGEKVADCVLLYGLGFTEPVPIDTWIGGALEDHYPELDKESYAETSRAARDRFGSYAGYAQAYLFHHLRTEA